MRQSTIMKKLVLFLLAIFSLSHFTFAQGKLSGNVAFGFGFPFTDLLENNYPGYKPNLGVGAGLGYQLNPYFKLRGDIMAINLNGNNALYYYQANIYEGSLGAEFNLARLFDKETNFKANIYGGLGLGLMHSSTYDIITRERVVEVPSNYDSANYSYNGQALVGLNFGIPINKVLDLNVGYTHRFVVDQPWIDGVREGDYTDSYGVANLGFTFYLGTPRDMSKIEVDPKKYRNLQSKADSLDRMAQDNQKTEEQIGRLEMSNQEKELQISMLQEQLVALEAENDSLEKAKTVIKTVTVSGASTSSGSEENEAGVSAFGDRMYRVVIGSLPTRKQAERYMERSRLDKTQMTIAYIEDVKTYRVVYKSASTYQLARKYLMEARKSYSDAWIIEF